VIVSPLCARLSCVYWTLVAVPFVCQVIAYALSKHNSIMQSNLFNPGLAVKVRPRSSRVASSVLSTKPIVVPIVVFSQRGSVVLTYMSHLRKTDNRCASDAKRANVAARET
jgi:hypothetical protein